MADFVLLVVVLGLAQHTFAQTTARLTALAHSRHRLQIMLEARYARRELSDHKPHDPNPSDIG